MRYRGWLSSASRFCKGPATQWHAGQTERDIAARADQHRARIPLGYQRLVNAVPEDGRAWRLAWYFLGAIARSARRLHGCFRERLHYDECADKASDTDRIQRGRG